MYMGLLSASSFAQSIEGYLEALRFPELDLKWIPWVFFIAVIGVILFGGKVSFATLNFETDGLIKKIIELREHIREDKKKGIEQNEAQYKLDKQKEYDRKKKK